MAPTREIDVAGLGARIEALPGFAQARAAARRCGFEAYLVGGSVRDALLGAAREDLDLVVEGDHLALARALGGPVREHARFATATVETEHGPVDVARARTETYERPGALPDVRPATLAEDLGRRDFTVNAIAVALARPGDPIDPHGGVPDLAGGTLRLLHAGSVADDPTRTLRGARYAARLDLEPDPATLAQLRSTELGTVSADRVDAELARIAREPRPRAPLELLERWGVLELGPERLAAVERLAGLLGGEPWAGVAAPERAIASAATADLGAARALARLTPERPSAAVEAARGHTGIELALARALGGEWLDRYVAEWRHVRPRITGTDLLAAGVPEGPGIGAGLSAALRARLDGRAGDREAELAEALAAARPGEAEAR